MGPGQRLHALFDTIEFLSGKDYSYLTRPPGCGHALSPSPGCGHAPPLPLPQVVVMPSPPPFSTPIIFPLGKSRDNLHSSRSEAWKSRCPWGQMHWDAKNTWVRFKTPQTRDLLSLSLPSSLEDLGTCYLLSESGESLEPEPRA